MFLYINDHYQANNITVILFLLKPWRMKKQIFTLSLLVFFSAAYAQKNLKMVLSGERGVSKHFTTLDENQQVAFNPSKARSTFGLDANSDLVLQNSETDNLGMTHHRYYQTYKGIPVENSMYIAHTQRGILLSMTGSVITDFDSQIANRSSSLSSNQAIEKALNFVNAKKYAWQDENFQQRIKFRKGNDATYYPVATNVWYSGDDEINPRNLKLAYKVDVYSVKPLDRKYIYVDAQSGKILGTNQVLKHSDATGTAATGYSGSKTIHSDYTGSAYRLRDYTKGKGIITLHAASGHADYTSASANFAYTTIDKWALDAHYGVAATYTYYKSNFNRYSIDNNGYALVSWVNDAANTNNAYWDGYEMDYGNLSSNSKGVVGIDVIGHELTHGVTQYTSALSYSKEPGAINESMSDIMGKSVQFYTKSYDSSWILSNDMGWEIRSFSNPNADGQPDTYKGKYWVTTSSDYYGVHTNSGVGNFMFYLLVKGGNGTNDIGNKYTVTGIGLAKAGQIIYRTNTTYLTSMSQYADWRTACIKAATDLYGAASNEVKQVQNAWYAAGIGTAGGTGGGTPSCTAPTGLAARSITGTSASLSWIAASGAAGYTLQWKSSSATSWTTVSGLTTSSYKLSGLTGGKGYQFQVKTMCSTTGSSYSTPFSFTTASGTTSITYCASKGTSSAYEYISKVALGSISNTSGNNNGYKEYTSLSTNLTTGSTYSIALTPGFPGSSYTEYWTVYIDYNKDGILNGTGETVAGGNGTTAKTLSFTIPSTAKTGTTRLRIQMRFSNSTTDPCATIDYGEVEDYTVNIVSPAGFTPLVSLSKDNGNKVSISPNPVRGSNALIKYQLADNGKVTMRIADMIGSSVQNSDLGYQKTGLHTFSLSTLNTLATGNYILVVEQNNKVIGRKHFMVVN